MWTVDIAPMPATARAQWLAPTQWPQGSEHLFTPGPFVAGQELPMISRYEGVRAALAAPPGTFSRVVPFEVIQEPARHRTLYAAWGLDGEEHRLSRGSLARINTGSTDEARAFTRDLTARLTETLLREPPPWDLARVIYEVSMQVVISHTMQAPMLLRHSRRLRELTRDHVAAEGGFFGISRDLAAEAILAEVIERHRELDEEGLAAHLVRLHQTRPADFTADHLVGQLWLLAVSAETQATSTATLIGMLLETGEYDFALSVLDEPEAMARLVDEGGRRGIVFPSSLLVATRPYEIDGHLLEAGRPCLISYAAANLDPEAFADPLRFDPRRRPARRHVAFGIGDHRCQGEVGANQFITDVTSTLLRMLPSGLRLRDGVLHRETGISMSIACLPVTTG